MFYFINDLSHDFDDSLKTKRDYGKMGSVVTIDNGNTE